MPRIEIDPKEAKLPRSALNATTGRIFALDKHPHKLEMIRALLRGESCSKVAKDFGGLSEVAVWRWKQANFKRYLGIDQAMTTERNITVSQQSAVTVDMFNAEAEKVRTEAWGFVNAAKGDADKKIPADLRAGVAALREVRETLRFEAELSGRLGNGGTTINVNIGVIQPRGDDEPAVIPAPQLALPAPDDPNIIDAEAIEPGE